MNAKQAKLLRTDNELLKRLTKYVALRLQKHRRHVTFEQNRDFSDVKVISPRGEIPWTKVSRFNDAEMKLLMIDVVNNTYAMMVTLFGIPDALLEDLLAGLRARDPQPVWDEPKSPFDPDKIAKLVDR